MRQAIYSILRSALCALMLSALMMASASATETAAPSSEMQTRPPAEMTEPPDIDTGQSGRTSGITGSDMQVEGEATGGGQSRGDALFQTDDSQSAAGPLYETSSPERESPTLPDDPLGAEMTGKSDDGVTQGSTSQDPD